LLEQVKQGQENEVRVLTLQRLFVCIVH
jgi:hypothetical protein